jgi:glycosyltransferase involved in cell wall biosynthesis
LLSVVNQTYLPIEIIVVDDQSSDDTRDVVNTLSKTHKLIRQICLGVNSGGPATPRNVGVRAAKGDFIAFIDSDDLWHPQKLEIQAHLVRNQSVKFTSTKSRKLLDGIDVKNERYNVDVSLAKNKVTEIKKRHFIGRNPLCTSSVLVEKALIEKVGFDPRQGSIAIEDYIAWRIIHDRLIDRSIRLNIPLVNYRVHSDSISSSKIMMAKNTFGFMKEYHRQNGNPLMVSIVEFFGYSFYGIGKRILRRFQDEWH